MRFTLVIWIPLFAATLLAQSPPETIEIPPTKIALSLDNQAIAVTTSGTIRRINPADDLYAVAISADLSDFQQNLTAILKPQLDRSDRCADHLDLQSATLSASPNPGSSTATIQVHYERWGCVKALGKQIVKKLVAGNAIIPVKLTPAVENNAVRVTAEAGEIQADGSLGELLRSGDIGEKLREKVQKSMQSAIDRSTDWKSTVPAALQELVTLREIGFRDSGAGRLALDVHGELHILDGALTSLRGKLH